MRCGTFFFQNQLFPRSCQNTPILFGAVAPPKIEPLQDIYQQIADESKHFSCIGLVLYLFAVVGSVFRGGLAS